MTIAGVSSPSAARPRAGVIVTLAAMMAVLSAAGPAPTPPVPSSSNASGAPFLRPSHHGFGSGIAETANVLGRSVNVPGTLPLALNDSVGHPRATAMTANGDLLFSVHGPSPAVLLVQRGTLDVHTIAAAAALTAPAGIAVRDDHVVIAGGPSHAVWLATTSTSSHSASVIAGSAGNQGYNDAYWWAPSARFRNPSAIAMCAGNGENCYVVADTGNNALRAVGTTSQYAAVVTLATNLVNITALVLHLPPGKTSSRDAVAFVTTASGIVRLSSTFEGSDNVVAQVWRPATPGVSMGSLAIVTGDTVLCIVGTQLVALNMTTANATIADASMPFGLHASTVGCVQPAADGIALLCDAAASRFVVTKVPAEQAILQTTTTVAPTPQPVVTTTTGVAPVTTETPTTPAATTATSGPVPPPVPSTAHPTAPPTSAQPTTQGSGGPSPSSTSISTTTPTTAAPPATTTDAPSTRPSSSTGAPVTDSSTPTATTVVTTPTARPTDPATDTTTTGAPPVATTRPPTQAPAPNTTTNVAPPSPPPTPTSHAPPPPTNATTAVTATGTALATTTAAPPTSVTRTTVECRLGGDHWAAALATRRAAVEAAVRGDLASAFGVAVDAVTVTRLAVGSLVVEAAVTHGGAADSAASEAVVRAMGLERTAAAYGGADANAVRLLTVTTADVIVVIGPPRGTGDEDGEEKESGLLGTCGTTCIVIVVLCVVALIATIIAALVLLSSASSSASGKGSDTESPNAVSCCGADDVDLAAQQHGIERIPVVKMTPQVGSSPSPAASATGHDYASSRSGVAIGASRDSSDDGLPGYANGSGSGSGMLPGFVPPAALRRRGSGDFCDLQQSSDDSSGSGCGRHRFASNPLAGALSASGRTQPRRRVTFGPDTIVFVDKHAPVASPLSAAPGLAEACDADEPSRAAAVEPDAGTPDSETDAAPATVATVVLDGCVTAAKPSMACEGAELASGIEPLPSPTVGATTADGAEPL